MYGALLIATANENAAGERDKENMWSNKHPHFESAHRRFGVFLLVSKGVLTLVSRASKIYCRGIQVHQPPPNLKATETFIYMQMLFWIAQEVRAAVNSDFLYSA